MQTQTTAAFETSFPAGRASLADTISDLHSRFSGMRQELQEAHSEIARLRRQVDEWRTGLDGMPETNVAALRRRVAFYCHPDRGGDASLMCNLNALFDFLEASQTLRVQEG